jgi:hypothetical protein
VERLEDPYTMTWLSHDRTTHLKGAWGADGPCDQAGEGMSCGDAGFGRVRRAVSTFMSLMQVLTHGTQNFRNAEGTWQ